LANIEKRRQRLWRLYRKLKKNNWQKFITSDEVWFYLSNSGGQRCVQYINNNEKYTAADVYQSRPEHLKGVMVWAGVSYNGKTYLRFVESGAKINKEYYIKKILSPFIRWDVKRLYPNRGFIFHQDSAPSHTAKATLEFLKSKRVEFTSPFE
jgi:hypothetical protein